MSTNAPKFLADRYRDSRPLYPASVFGLLENARCSNSPAFLDLGCGTGLSTRSFLEWSRWTRGYAVDPDAAMLAVARADLGETYPKVSFMDGAAERLPLPDAAVDLVLVGSAIHWFEIARAQPEILRVLKPGGLLFVFEYQFPKCLDDTVLAETVRRRFNLEWKAPIQRPRGTLADLVAPFRASPDWEWIGEERPDWREVLSHKAFLGHLFSQSRYLHAEAAQPDPAAYRREITEAFAPFFAAGIRTFDLKPRAIALRRVDCGSAPARAK